MLRKIYGPVMVNGVWRSNELHQLWHGESGILTETKISRIGWAEVTYKG